LADRAEPGIFAEKRVLFAPGLNHTGLAQALVRHTTQVRYADPIIFFGMPDLPLVGSKRTLEQAASRTRTNCATSRSAASAPRLANRATNVPPSHSSGRM
jgi:hypothetical protein